MTPIQLLKEASRIKLFEDIKATKDFGLLVDILKSTLDALNKQKEEVVVKTDDIEAKLEAKIKNIELKKGDRGEQGPKGDSGDTVVGPIGPVGPRGPQGETIRGERGVDGKDGKDGKDGANGKDGKEGSRDTGDEIVDKINAIPLDTDDAEDHKIEIEHIKGLRKLLSKLSTQTTVTGGGTKGKTKSYDLSGQLNGVLKTFTLPAFWNVISVVSSSFPSAFRPVIDYTVDGSAMTITFTSEIEVSGTLASGQTLIVLYEEA